MEGGAEVACFAVALCDSIRCLDHVKCGLDASAAYISRCFFTFLFPGWDVNPHVARFCRLEAPDDSVLVRALMLEDSDCSCPWCTKHAEFAILSPDLMRRLSFFPVRVEEWTRRIRFSALILSESARAVPRATSVTLARLSGCKYPTNNAVEDRLLQAYLLRSRRFLRVGGVFTLFKSCSSAAASAWPTTAGHEGASFGTAPDGNSFQMATVMFDYCVVALEAEFDGNDDAGVEREVGEGWNPSGVGPTEKARVALAMSSPICKITLQGGTTAMQLLDPRLTTWYARHVLGNCICPWDWEGAARVAGPLGEPKREATAAVLNALLPTLDERLEPTARKVVCRCPLLVAGPISEATRVLIHVAAIMGLRPLVLPVKALQDSDVWRVYFAAMNRRKQWGLRPHSPANNDSWKSSTEISTESSIPGMLARTGPSLLVFTGLADGDSKSSTDGGHDPTQGLTSSGENSHVQLMRTFLDTLWAQLDAEEKAGQKSWPVLVTAVARSDFPSHGALAALFPTHLRPALGGGGEVGLVGSALQDSITAELGCEGAGLLKEELERASLSVRRGGAWCCALGLDSASSPKSTAATAAADVNQEKLYRELRERLAAPLVKRGSRAAPVAAVYWEDLGGLDGPRSEILDVIQLPTLYPHLFAAGAPRTRGVLLFGPPGTGKTLVAKAVATECQVGFMSIKGPELLDAYVGESEKNVRMVFEEARRTAPTVIFFDELDSLAPARGRSSDGGGVMDRIVSQLLTEMDTISANGDPDKTVFVIGATNRPDLLDAALLRPGRLDKRIFLGPMETLQSKAAVLTAQTRNMKLASCVDLSTVAAALPELVTGADIGACTQAAYQRALGRRLRSLEEEARRSAGDPAADMWTVASYVNTLPADSPLLTVEVEQEDLVDSARAVTPAMDKRDLARYLALKEF